MRPKVDSKVTMLEHSKAKVELYRRYLSIYLNILSQARSTDRIYIFDLLCGEGVYQDGSKGSPLATLESIREHYFSHNQTCPPISIWFNDKGLSEIEGGVYKVDRVKRFSEQQFIPSNVDVSFFRENYTSIITRALDTERNSRNVKRLFFIDFYGYKDVRPIHIKTALESKGTEVLLFLPASYMYRFAERSVLSVFPGGEALRDFLIELYGTSIPKFSSVHNFIDQIKEIFRHYLSDNNIFVDTFTLQRDKQNTYALFFFTSHPKGFEKMLETKWRLDTEQGKGFKLQQTPSLFSEVELSDYPTKLANFIRDNQPCTNRELYLFGLENGFLPKHTREILRDWKDQGRLEVLAVDEKPVQGFYLDYNSERRVTFRLRS